MIACPICENSSFRRIRNIKSKLNQIPDGLDRSNEVEVRIEKFSQCGLLRTLNLEDQRSTNELYEESSVCFDVSFMFIRRLIIIRGAWGNGLSQFEDLFVPILAIQTQKPTPRGGDLDLVLHRIISDL